MIVHHEGDLARNWSCSNEAQNSAVYTHLKDSGHSFKTQDIVILDKEPRWHERGVREAVWERIEQPSLNKKGGLRFQLSRAWDGALRQVPGRLSHDLPNGSSSSSLA